MCNILTGTESIVGQKKRMYNENIPFVNRSTCNNTHAGVKHIPTPENPGVVMAKIAQSSQIVGVIDNGADTNIISRALQYVQQTMPSG